ncbi:hypothetical protein COT72_05650 [archaeon CG10_big_fil_rev_8_21_14_0_10_43_11]|nr:MAG: hypothetical protein COT72_05650 [archaeon CG10_big_fil_rev_8_21_14_0_10_43_11]
MKKGVILSIDLMIGIVIALSFTTLLIYKADITEPVMEKNVLLTLKARDALRILDLTHAFETQNETRIAQQLDLIFPFETYEFEIRYYNTNFTAYLLARTGDVTDDFITVKHPFYYLNTTPTLGIAILRLTT